jgi:hypothetical protein
MKKPLLYFFMVFAIAACQKEIDGGLASKSGDYQPVSINSLWYYNSTSAVTFSVKSVGTDSTINGRSFYRFDHKTNSGTSRAYISKWNGIYRQYGNFAPAGGQVIELVYLKDTLNGATWTNTITAGGFKNYHKYTVTAKDIDYKVGGVLYTNVIELSYEFSIDNPLGGGVIKTGSGKQYYARNIGAIESYFNCSYLGFNTSDTTRLATYMIW